MSQYSAFRVELLDWYRENGRHFYWRTESLSPFDILLTEMLLKRTKAETVDRYGEDILETLSTPEVVLEKERSELKGLLQPFGLYNRRAKNLKNVCQALVSEFDGEIPRKKPELISITGIGEYIADSILCFAYDEPVVVLDTNTSEVAATFFGVTPADDLRLDNTVRPALKPLVEQGNPKEINWALLDLGADIIRRGTDSTSYPLEPVSCNNLGVHQE